MVPSPIEGEDQQQVFLHMNSGKTIQYTVDLPGDLAAALHKAAVANDMAAEELIAECVAQHCETALRHRVLIQRQNDVDEALLELARLVGRLSAGASKPQADICRYPCAKAE
jgi:hypothetical protein